MAGQAARQQRKQGHRRKVVGPQGRTAPGRIIALGAITVAILVIAGYLLWPVVRPDRPAAAGAVTVQLSMGGFSHSRIEARAGKPITLRLVNKDNRFHSDGGGWHQFAIDELEVNVKVAPLKTREFTFTPARSGSFQFYCDVCCGGRQNPAMVGTLTVKA